MNLLILFKLLKSTLRLDLLIKEAVISDKYCVCTELQNILSFHCVFHQFVVVLLFC